MGDNMEAERVLKGITRHAMFFCCIVLLASVGAMKSITSSKKYLNKDTSTNQRLETENYRRKDDIRFMRRTQHPFFPNVNEIKVDVEGISLPKRRLDDPISTSPCSLCDRLGASTNDNYVPHYNASCQEIEYYYTSMANECKVDPWLEGLCCDLSGALPSYVCENEVREKILGSYDTAIAPGSVNTRLVHVDTFMLFQYLSGVDVTTSSMEVYLTVDLRWKDPRLAWDVSSTSCVSSIDVRASKDPEKTDIWTP